jgi:hypothetical protein
VEGGALCLFGISGGFGHVLDCTTWGFSRSSARASVFELRGRTLDVAWMVASTEMIVDTSAFCILFKGVSYVMFLSILKTHTRQRQE